MIVSICASVVSLRISFKLFQTTINRIQTLPQSRIRFPRLNIHQRRNRHATLKNNGAQEHPKLDNVIHKSREVIDFAAN